MLLWDVMLSDVSLLPNEKALCFAQCDMHAGQMAQSLEEWDWCQRCRFVERVAWLAAAEFH